jgi:hypothetical protein
MPSPVRKEVTIIDATKLFTSRALKKEIENEIHNVVNGIGF